MKKHQSDLKSLWWLFTGLLLSLCSCSGNLRPSPSPLPIPTMTMPSETPTLTATKIFTPVISTSLITETSLPSMIPLPTLADYKVQEYLTNLIQNSQNCKLPCWWGLTPGISTWQDAKDFMFHLGYNEIDSTQYDDLDERLDINKLQIVQELIMDKKTDVVSRIIFKVDGSYNPAGFQSIWNLYSPKKFLVQYGRPTRVLLQTSTVYAEPPENNKVGYELWLFYDQSGFLIRYSSVGIRVKDKIHICPIFRGQEDDLWTLWLYLQNPASLSPLEYLVDNFQNGGMDYMHPLDVATGLSIDQFMELSQSNSFCFDTPVSIWP